MSSNNSNSTNPFANSFNPYNISQVPEEKLEQFENRTMMASHYQQQQFQHQLFQQQQFQMQQQQLQQADHFQPQNLNVNQGFVPLDTTQPTTTQSLHAMMNTGIFSSFNSNNSNPFEPSPIEEKITAPSMMSYPTNVVSSTPATFVAAQAANSNNAMKKNAKLPMSINKTKKLLPEGFEPCDKTIICGNKRKYFESPGNIRFRSVCKMFTKDYNAAPTKVEKSAVVSRVMAILRQDCPDGGASVFVTPQGGRWYAVSERTSREKVGTFFRDCLADTYKSSAKNKIAKRKMVKQEKSTGSCDSSSADSRQCHKKPSAAKAVPPNNKKKNNDDNDSLGSMSFYDVNDFTPVKL